MTSGSVALMTLVQGRAVVSLSTPDLVKMDERKRLASHDHDGTEPPLKRQATVVNGTSKNHIDADMPWKDDLEVRKPCRVLYQFTLSERHPPLCLCGRKVFPVR